MRIVDAEDPYPFVYPELKYMTELFPQRRPILTFKIQWINVLVFLRWVFSVLHRAIRSPAKPLRVQGDIRMIGCGLKRNVERDLNVTRTCCRNQATKVLHCAEFRVNRSVSS